MIGQDPSCPNLPLVPEMAKAGGVDTDTMTFNYVIVYLVVCLGFFSTGPLSLLRKSWTFFFYLF